MSLQRVLADTYHSLPRQAKDIVEPLAGMYVSAKEFSRMRARVGVLSPILNARLHQYSGLGVFIDLGFNSGVALDCFYQSLSQRFQFHGIEVNKKRFFEAAQALKKQRPRIFSLEFGAVSTHNGSAFYYENGPGFGRFPYISTTAENEFGRPSTKINPQEAQSIDFPRWLENILKFYREQNNAEPYVVVKMDIEGSEFSVLEALINRGLHRSISDLIVEFHGGRFASPDFQEELQRRQDQILKTLDQDSVGVHPWI